MSPHIEYFFLQNQTLRSKWTQTLKLRRCVFYYQYRMKEETIYIVLKVTTIFIPPNDGNACTFIENELRSIIGKDLIELLILQHLNVVFRLKKNEMHQTSTDIIMMRNFSLNM